MNLRLPSGIISEVSLSINGGETDGCVEVIKVFGSDFILVPGIPDSRRSKLLKDLMQE